MLRVNTSYVAFASLVEPHQGEFARRFPDVTLEVMIDNSFADIVAEGFDVGIRLGRALQNDMIGLPLGPAQPMAVVAAPGYLAARGTPGVPADLLAHDCIRQRIGKRARFFEWHLKEHGQATAIKVRGRLVYSDMICALDAARQGLGLAYVFRQFAEPGLGRGELVAVLDDHCVVREPFYLYYANRGQMPGKLRAFIDFIQAANRPARDRGD